MADVRCNVLAVQAAAGPQVITGDLGGATPKCIMVFSSYASTKNAVNSHSTMCFGWYSETFQGGDVTNGQYSQIFQSLHGLSTSYVKAGHCVDELICFPSTAADLNYAAKGPVTLQADGFTINWDVTPPSNWMLIWMFAGADFQSNMRMDINAGTPHVVDYGFTPDVVFARHPQPTSSSFGVADAIIRAGCGPTLGVYPDPTEVANQLNATYVSRNARTTQRAFSELNNALISNQQLETGDNGYNWTVTGAAGNTVTYNNTNSRPRDAMTMAMNFGGNAFDIRTITAPATVSAQPITGLGFQPTVMCAFGNNANVYGRVNNAVNRSLFNVGMKQGTNPGVTVQCADTPNVSTTVTHSRFNDTVDYSAFSTSTQQFGADITLDADGYTFDWQTLADGGPSTKHLVFVLDADIGGGVGPGTPVISQLTPDWMGDGQVGNIITGTDFGATQGIGKVEVTDGGTTVDATITSWSDTSIECIYNTTGINLGAVNVIVTNSSGTPSSPSPATHLATIAASGSVTTGDLNARMNRSATNSLTPTQDAEFTKHISRTAIGGTVIIPTDIRGR